mgnify:CR=1 FL=1
MRLRVTLWHAAAMADDGEAARPLSKEALIMLEVEAAL